MLTILDMLKNAEVHIENGHRLLAEDNIHNAIVLLEKRYDIYDSVDPLIAEYGSVENVPDKRALLKGLNPDPEKIS